MYGSIQVLLGCIPTIPEPAGLYKEQWQKAAESDITNTIDPIAGPEEDYMHALIRSR
jgi:hypothetical protein